VITFQDLVQLSAELGELAREVSAPFLARGQNHVRNAWHGYYKRKLLEIIRVARMAHPEFRDPSSYDLCYQVTLEALKTGQPPDLASELPEGRPEGTDRNINT
jgi:hypothetical protein